jgi:hypothetical protein
MQILPVDRPVRRSVAFSDPRAEWKSIENPARSGVMHDEPFRLGDVGAKIVLKSKRPQNARSVWSNLDTGTLFRKRCTALENMGGNAAPR